MKKSNGLRHGEAVLLPVDGAMGKSTGHKIFIVAHSESGHNHVLESKTSFNVIEDKDNIFLELFAPASLVHKKQIDKHKTLIVKPGIYQIKKKLEYDPWSQVIRAVFD